jgi:hypothetical protein
MMSVCTCDMVEAYFLNFLGRAENTVLFGVVVQRHGDCASVQFVDGV